MAYKIQQKSRFIVITLIFVLLIPFLNISGTVHTVQAQGNAGKTYTLLEPLPCLTGNEVGCVGGKTGQIKNMDLGSFFQYAFNLLIALSAVSAVFMMVWGGFKYMTTDSWQGSKDGLEKFKNAIYGLLMVLAAFLILKTVNPKLVAIPASITPINVPASMQQSPLTAFDELNKLATNVPEARNNLSQAKKELTDLQNQRAELELERQSFLNQGLSDDDPEVQYLDVQIAQLYDNEINKHTDILVSQEAITMKNYLTSSDCNGHKNINECFNIINTAYNNYLKTQYAINNPDAQNRLKQQKDWTEAMLEINAEVSQISDKVKSGIIVASMIQSAKATPIGYVFKSVIDKLTPNIGLDDKSAQESITYIENLQKDYSKKLINNPDLQNQLQKTTESAVQAINSLKKKK